MNDMTAVKRLAVPVLLLALLSCRGSQNGDGKAKQADVAASVKVQEVKKHRISEKRTFTGVLEPWQKVNITPDIGGKIDRIYVREGERVQKGQILSELDTRAIRLQLKQAEAGLAVAEAGFEDAKKNLERMDRLSQENAISDQQYEKGKLAFNAAEAQLEQAKAALNLARYNLDVSIMKAPFSGIVASKNADVGDVINPMMGGFSPVSGVLTLMDYSKIKIILDISQNDILLMKKGQAAVLKVASFPGRDFMGTVYLVNPTADPVAKNFRVEVEVDNPGLALRPNTFGEVTVEISSREDALTVPQMAIIGDRYVFVAKDGKAHKREVTLGLQNSNMVEITTGIREGDLVIYEGNYGLEDGSSIEIFEVKK